MEDELLGLKGEVGHVTTNVENKEKRIQFNSVPVKATIVNRNVPNEVREYLVYCRSGDLGMRYSGFSLTITFSTKSGVTGRK